MKNILILKSLGLSAGISSAIVLNLPMLEFKTTIPLTIFGLIGVVCLIIYLILDRRFKNIKVIYEKTEIEYHPGINKIKIPEEGIKIWGQETLIKKEKIYGN